MTNFEKIKNMSVEEMAKLFVDISVDNCICCNSKNNCKNCFYGYQQWLESEAENEQ